MAKIFIIGGGASGIIAALKTCKNNDVTILEHNNTLAKKILITGNGHCNYWNDDLTFSNYNSSNKELIKEIINDNNKANALNMLNKIGIIPKIKNGYYYPYSNQAISFQNALINAVNKSNIKVITECEVESIYKIDKFQIKTSKATYEADKVIIATGGYAYPKTGSNGIGYKLATSLGHTLIKPLPALVQLITNDKEIKTISGVRSDVKITLMENNQIIKVEEGELQHTDYGLSGICAMQLSSKIARGLDENKKETVLINYIPSIASSLTEFKKWFNDYKDNTESITISEFLDQLVNYKLTNLFLKKDDINPKKYLKDITDIEIERIANSLINYEMSIIGTKSFDSSQTTSGGIPLTEINCHTMESKKVKNLYFCGEIIDIDGACGGYNLGAAWITGYIAGNNASKGEYNDNN